MRPTTEILRMLEEHRSTFGSEASGRIRALLAELGHRPLPTRSTLVRYHELLCWWRAYPHDPLLLAEVATRLDSFDRRADLKRFRAELVGSGIAGTDITFPFFYFTAGWLAPNSVSHWENWADEAA